MRELTIPEDLKEEYPFKSNFLLKNGLKYHYVDEGKGDPVLFLHGNPTWSFYYRNLIKGLQDNYRCIAPDHIGCGLSSKPEDYEYTLENHIQNLVDLVKKLDLHNIRLVVHDWGGAIGMGLATRMPERIKGIVYLNTAAFRSKRIPYRIAVCKIPTLGEWMVRKFNAFAYPATFMATSKGLSKNVKKGFLLPYSDYQSRIATAKFVQDIPLSSKHRSYETLKEIELKLKDLDVPKMFIWGAKDFCFNLHFLKKWQEIYPSAKVNIYDKADHYVIEDEKEKSLQDIKLFFSKMS